MKSLFVQSRKCLEYFGIISFTLLHSAKKHDAEEWKVSKARFELVSVSVNAGEEGVLQGC